MRYKPHSAAAVMPGQHIRVTIKTTDVVPATFITTEGVVDRVSGRRVNEEHVPTTAHFRGGVSSDIVSVGSFQAWGLDLVLPDLPTAVGSAIKIYDVNLLRDRLAVLRHNGMDEKVWEIVETGVKATASELERAEVVFDGDPNTNG